MIYWEKRRETEGERTEGEKENDEMALGNPSVSSHSFSPLCLSLSLAPFCSHLSFPGAQMSASETCPLSLSLTPSLPLSLSLSLSLTLSHTLWFSVSLFFL